MLMLTRRINETICIADNIKITVKAVKGNQVVIGIDAPKDTPVHRLEIYEKIQANNENEKIKATNYFQDEFYGGVA